jgi:hypothetical protein
MGISLDLLTVRWTHQATWLEATETAAVIHSSFA